uniref:SnoaL-like domain-containing protein n=1 Tax=Aegilops tauschii subsp. strangulata TaxID=200361 RepID=A0A453FIX9_AEGTS
MSAAQAASAILRPSASAPLREVAFFFTDNHNPSPARLCIRRRSAERTFAGLQIAASNFNRSRICHVKSGEADGYPKTEEDKLADEETLQHNLDRAIREEDYARAAKIRDDLRILHEGRISGYDVVLQSWEMVCNADYEFPLNIDLKNIEVHVRGDLGYVTCLELVKTKGKSWGKQIATNVFEKTDGTCEGARESGE